MLKRFPNKLPMEIRQLAAFEAVVTSGSLSRAATIVNTSQPSVSKQIQMLEQSVGTQLFQRTGQGMRLTEAGDAILPAVRDLLGFWSSWTEGLSCDRFAEQSAGTRVWASDFAMSLTGFFEWLNKLDSVVKDSSGIHLEIISNESGNPDWGELEQGGTDLVICPSWDAPDEDSNFNTAVAFETQPCAYSSDQVFSTTGEKPRGHDISAVVLDRNSSRGYFHFLEDTIGSTPPVAESVRTVSAALTAVALGQGGFLGGDHPVDDASIPVTKVPIKTKPPIGIVAVWNKERADLGDIVKSSSPSASPVITEEEPVLA
ncbi:MAG: LysR family transcriptional regulator [Verrucomicrobiota bacterium]